MSTIAGFAPKIAAFVVAMLVGGSVAYVAASALNRPALAPTAREAPEFLSAGPGGDAIPAAFDLIDAQREPTLIPGLAPADLALASDTLIETQPVAALRPLGFPRVTPVTQFDGGPFASVNCTLAAGAMLARLGFGIVTTGSILRTLQDDQVGGTGFDDLATALFRGYGVSIDRGLITPTQLKDLLSAGYGAVIIGSYAEIPVGLRLQGNFTGAHAVYVDGYYPGDAVTPAAYYIIDPIGHGGGYRGDWWPASVVDAFTLALSYSGRISAAWVFPPGGTPPDVVPSDVLPIPPSGGEEPTPGPGESPAATLGPGESPPSEEPGDVPPADPPVLGDPPVLDGAVIGDLAIDPVLEICLFEPKPPGCPGGIEGVFEIPFPFLEFALGPAIEIVAVDSRQPNIVFVAFTVTPGAPADVRFWDADGSPSTVESATSMEVLPLPGDPPIVARLDVLAATTYHFQVVAGDGLFSSASPVGTFTTGSGVSAFDVALNVAADPVFDLGVGVSPYLHLTEGAFAFPLVALENDSTPSGCLVIDFGGDPFCLFPEPTIETPPCTRADVSYALTGMGESGVYVRAFPTEAGEATDGSPSLAGVLEAEGPAGSGDVSIGCLASGLTYQIALDAIGDDRGVLVTETISVP